MGCRETPVQVIVHGPQTEAGREELARRVAVVHADAVDRAIGKLGCPVRQKRQLLEAVIQTAKDEMAARRL